MSCSKGPTLWRGKTDWSQISPTRPAQSLCSFATLRKKKEQVLSFFSVPETYSEFTECWTSIHGTDPPGQWRFYWQFQHGNFPHSFKQVEMKEPAGSKTVLFIPNVRTNNKQSPPLLETTRPRASVEKDWVLQCKLPSKVFRNILQSFPLLRFLRFLLVFHHDSEKAAKRQVQKSRTSLGLMESSNMRSASCGLGKDTKTLFPRSLTRTFETTQRRNVA